MHRIKIISAGPGGRDYLTFAALRAIEDCEVVIGTRGQLDSAGLSGTGSIKAVEENRVEEIMKKIEKYEGSRLGVLVTGDAGIYSLCQKVSERYGRDALESVIPGVSSLQVAFARVKEPWVNVRVFSFHGRPVTGIDDIIAAKRAAIMCDRENGSRAILTILAARSLFDNPGKASMNAPMDAPTDVPIDVPLKVYVCQDLTMPEEKVIEIKTAGDIENIGACKREIILILRGN
ncbi:MAG: precorrin-6y C5,15-methyltransferase (decarboxylating) subunit CbiE [Nitrospirae bacterium]|nr:precorrin-6y C5,15-methyltransferase (decarboxylating) subunit CbiE [Nitrospirota bacterium]